MTEPIQRVVLRDTVTRDEIDDAVSACGCRLINIVPPSESHPGQIFYATSDRTEVFVLVEDGRLGAIYFTGQGKSSQHDLKDLAGRLACYGLDQIEKMLSRPEDEDAFTRALGFTVLCASEGSDDRRIAAFRTAFEHPSSQVRHAALVAISYAPAEALRPDVAHLAASDEEPMVRVLAERILESLFVRGGHDH